MSPEMAMLLGKKLRVKGSCLSSYAGEAYKVWDEDETAYWIWYADDLRPADPPAEKKYRILKPISVQAVGQAGACKPELYKFSHFAMQSGIGYSDEISLETALEIATMCIGGVEWLKDKDFIGESEPDTPFERWLYQCPLDQWQPEMRRKLAEWISNVPHQDK